MKKNANKTSAAEADAAYRTAKRRVVEDRSGASLSFEPAPQSKSMPLMAWAIGSCLLNGLLNFLP